MYWNQILLYINCFIRTVKRLITVLNWRILRNKTTLEKQIRCSVHVTNLIRDIIMTKMHLLSVYTDVTIASTHFYAM